MFSGDVDADVAKAGEKVKEEDTTWRGRYEGHGMDT